MWPSSWTATAAGRDTGAFRDTPGHLEGMKAVRDTVEGACAAGVGILTLFAFSTENWKRPSDEIEALMGVLQTFADRERDALVREGVEVRVLGELDRLDGASRSAVDRIMEATRGGSSLVLNLLISYGAREEMARAARALAVRARDGLLDPERIDTGAVARALYTGDLPDPDLLIRTSGEFSPEQLHALAAGLLGAALHSRALARLHPRRSLRRHPRLSAARTALRPGPRRDERVGGASAESLPHVGAAPRAGTAPHARAASHSGTAPVISPELRARILVAAVGIPLALVAVYIGGWALAAVLSFVAAVAAREFFNLAEPVAAEPDAAEPTAAEPAAAEPDPARRPLRWLGMLASALLVVLAAVEPDLRRWAGHAFMVLLLLGLASLAAAVFDMRVRRVLPTVAATVAGALYTGGTLSFRHPCPQSARGKRRISRRSRSRASFFSCCPCWSSGWGTRAPTSRAGSSAGGGSPRALAPARPWKAAWRGCWDRVAMGFALGFALDDHPNFPVSAPAGAMIGLLLGIAGQLGDLAESRLKREAGVKDSGGILPGHGGMLDRFDALFFALPLAYALIVVHGAQP